ncbi:hypothetical protein A2U01_0102366, partial [Trifolium medium]|nr:hypothetical protein [Trifolium medium]
ENADVAEGEQEEKEDDEAGSECEEVEDSDESPTV